jgi:peptidoglycan/LPS O-acetylase OafA/YrhL
MRLKPIDFLRGIAIILVLFRHVDYVPLAHKIGWAGVDLFFVLSGFLVSGLLFHEFNKYKEINAKQFLIRRAFKIYPLFWLVLIYVVFTHNLTGFGSNKLSLYSEVFFFQNYTLGLLHISWSLAVEEHFYLLLTLAIYIATKWGNLQNKKAFHSIAFSVLAVVLITRFIVNYYYPTFDTFIHYTPTHMRIDSLTFGVILAYNYQFNKRWLQKFVLKNKLALSIATFILLFPVFIFSNESYFIRTIGYSTTYIGFGLLLVLFLFNAQIEKALEKPFALPIYNVVAKIGTWSYALYLVHMLVYIFFRRLTERMLGMQAREITMLVCYITVSLIAAYALTELVEKPVLALRDKYFPKKKVQQSNQTLIVSKPI